MSDRSETKACLTPNTYYQYGTIRKHILDVRLVFPFQMQDWSEGRCAITAIGRSDKQKLLAYEQMYAERQRLQDMIHDAMEPVGADCYRVMRELDVRLGTNNVERGVIKPYRPLPFED